MAGWGWGSDFPPEMVNSIVCEITRVYLGCVVHVDVFALDKEQLDNG